MKRLSLLLPLAAALAGLLLFLWLRRPQDSRPPAPPPPPPQGKEVVAAPERPWPGTAPADAAKGGSLLLQVKAQGAPLGAADVVVIREGQPARMRFQTGADGTRLILQIPSGHYVATASHPRYLQGEIHLEVRDGERTTGSIDLQRGGRIHGRVTDLSGTGLSRANVSLIEAETRSGAGSHLAVKTDEAGRYEIAAAPPGDWGLRVRHERFKPREHLGLAVSTGAEEYEVNIALEVGARVSGRVLDGQGAPLPGARILFGNEGGGAIATSDAAGRFTVYGLSDGPVNGSATLKGYGTAYRRGVPPNSGDLEFRLLRAGTLEGRLLAEPLPEHFTVALSRFEPDLGKPLRIHQQAFTSAICRGLVRIEDLAPGTYWVEVEAEGYTAAEMPQVTIAPGQASAALTLRLNRN